MASSLFACYSFGTLEHPPLKSTLASKGISHVPQLFDLPHPLRISAPISEQKCTISAPPRLSIPSGTRFFYEEPVYKEPTGRRPKYLKNLYY